MDNPAEIPIKRRRPDTYITISVLITGAGLYLSNTPAFTCDKSVEFIKSVTLTTDNEQALFNMQQRLEINRIEILPQEFEARVLYCYANVSPSDRFFDLNNEPAGNGSIKITCFDGSSPTGFVPYTANYTFRLQLKELV